MWYCPDKYNFKVTDINEQLLKIKGTLEEEEARITLAKFLRHNIGFTVELISGIKLAPYQEITLKGFFNRNFSMCVWTRGGSKSFIAAVYCFLQCIFEPNSKILIAGPTFRTARNIFNELERIVNKKEAQLLAQCFTKEPSKRNDIHEWEINGGIIRAIPLNGEKVRGFRANILVLDEFLLLPEQVVKTVLMPFLTSPQNVAERIKIRTQEDALIKKGLLKEEDRIKFKNSSKMIALSSASYTFENLYKTYTSWIEKIQASKKEEIELLKQELPELLEQGVPTYFISQIGYEALPSYMVDPTIIQESKNGGASNAAFAREYGAQFVDGSDSYYSAKKMMECTIPDGEQPTLLLKGDFNKKYILSIDPSFSDSPSSDHFAMSIIELDDETRKPVLVHQYAVAGGDLKDHHKYLYYLLKNFPTIELIIIDNAGHEFIKSANESSLFQENDIKIEFIDFDSTAEGEDYQKEIIKLKSNHNRQSGCIAIKQFFSSTFIRKANEHLKSMIDYKKIFFGSRINPNDSAFARTVSYEYDLSKTPFKEVADFIDFQDDWINQVKKQCSLLEIKITPQGNQSFDLPNHLRSSTRADRARKDSYTALLLAAWGHKCYYDMLDAQIEATNGGFTPFLI
jgi:hypothetical protein